MVYLKSLAAGTAAVAIAAALSPIVMAVYFYLVYRTRENQAIGWDPTSLVTQPSIWAICALIFVSGFVWEFRRAQPK